MPHSHGLKDVIPLPPFTVMLGTAPGPGRRYAPSMGTIDGGVDSVRVLRAPAKSLLPALGGPWWVSIINRKGQSFSSEVPGQTAHHLTLALNHNKPHKSPGASSHPLTGVLPLMQDPASSLHFLPFLPFLLYSIPFFLPQKQAPPPPPVL